MSTKLAVIPARGGSARLKGKNTYPIAGKPLIAYTVEAVHASQCFDTIIVSTDCTIIAETALRYGPVKIYKRSSELAGDRVTVVEALLAMMMDLDPYDVFAYFLPTCPFRSAADIRAGVSMLTADVDSVISVSKYSEPPQLAMLKRGNDVLPVFDNLRAGITNSRFLSSFFKPNGGYYIGWWNRILQNRNFFTGNVQGFELPKERSVDIDDILDVRYAEAVLSELSARVETVQMPAGTLEPMQQIQSP